MASNQKNNSTTTTEPATEASTPVIGTPPLNASRPHLNVTNLSRRLGTLKRNSSLAKQEYKKWKGTQNSATRFAMRHKFAVWNSTNNNGRPLQITVYKPTGEEVNRTYHGGKRHLRKKYTKKGKKRA